MLLLVGAPSQLDTWDMKPNAPGEMRGPFKPIATNVPGIQISEIFPADGEARGQVLAGPVRVPPGAAVHDTGHQMMQTGRLFQRGVEYPHVGCVLGYLKGGKGDLPPHVLLPRPIGRTGGNMPHGQTAGYLGKAHDPFVLNADPSDPDFKVPDLLPPDYISAVRADRRRNLRDLVDGPCKQFESSPDARLLNASFEQAYTLIRRARRARRSTCRRSRTRSRTATAATGSARAACWRGG